MIINEVCPFVAAMVCQAASPPISLVTFLADKCLAPMFAAVVLKKGITTTEFSSVTLHMFVSSSL